MEPVIKRFKLDASSRASFASNMKISDANFVREMQRLRKEEKNAERDHQRNTRKIDTARQEICSLLGQPYYPDCKLDHLLFHHKVPGFCYSRNGAPRLVQSLVESKSRKIVHDLEGKQGVFMEPAKNIISDSPSMTEMLNTPEAVALLCDLRTTAALLEDKELFAQFAMSLVHNPNNPIPLRGGDAHECLTAYRQHLIEKLFQFLEPATDDPPSNSNPHPDETRRQSGDLMQLPSPQSYSLGRIIPSDLAQQGKGFKRLVPDEGKAENLSLPLRRNIEFNRLGSLLPPPPNAENSKAESLRKSAIKILPPDTPSTPSLATLGNTVQRQDRGQARLRDTSMFDRNRVTSIVNSLMSDVENLAVVGETMGQLYRKRPQYMETIRSLKRLLKNDKLLPVQSNVLRTIRARRRSSYNNLGNSSSSDLNSQELRRVRTELKKSRRLEPGNADMASMETEIDPQFLPQTESKEVQNLASVKEQVSISDTNSGTDCGSVSSSASLKNERASRAPHVSKRPKASYQYRERMKERHSSNRRGKNANEVVSKRIAFTTLYAKSGTKNASGRLIQHNPRQNSTITSSTLTNSNATLCRELSEFVLKSQTKLPAATVGSSSTASSVDSRMPKMAESNGSTTSSTKEHSTRKLHYGTWTLRVNKADLLKLKHELEVGTMRMKVKEFESKCFV